MPIRKPGKLPGRVEKAGFTKEYGDDGFEIQGDVIGKGKKVLVIDDILATGEQFPFPHEMRSRDAGWSRDADIWIGGSAAAAAELIDKAGGVLLGFVFILGLTALQGEKKLKGPVHTLLSTTQAKAST